MPRPALFDTSVYISALRRGDGSILLKRRMDPDSLLWLSAVVLEELYAGVRPADGGILDRLKNDFEKARRLLVPNLSDWVQAGKVLAWVGAEHGYEEIGRARLTNDALIAMSAARSGITIFTVNGRDFKRLKRYREFDLEIAN